MSKTVKCLLLKVDTVIVTEIQELDADFGEPNCKLVNPYEFTDDKKLIPWPEVTDQKEMMIHSDSILTIVEPSAEIVKQYLELTT